MASSFLQRYRATVCTPADSTPQYLTPSESVASDPWMHTTYKIFSHSPYSRTHQVTRNAGMSTQETKQGCSPRDVRALVQRPRPAGRAARPGRSHRRFGRPPRRRAPSPCPLMRAASRFRSSEVKVLRRRTAFCRPVRRHVLLARAGCNRYVRTRAGGAAAESAGCFGRRQPSPSLCQCKCALFAALYLCGLCSIDAVLTERMGTKVRNSKRLCTKKPRSNYAVATEARNLKEGNTQDVPKCNAPT